MTPASFLGFALGLSIFLAVNATVSMITLSVWSIGRRVFPATSPRIRARMAVACRVLPVVVATLAAAAFFLPAWVEYEPLHTNEHVGLRLAILAVLSSAAFFSAAARVYQLTIDTHRLSRSWSHFATPITIEGLPIDASAIAHPFPVMAVVGVLRPRLFVARQICETLSPDELAAAAAHEVAHVELHDNLKRAAMVVCRALLPLPGARRLDAEWSQTSEVAADEAAASRRPGASLDLASALVKIARLAPRGVPMPRAAAAYITGTSTASIAERVRLLANRTDEREADTPRHAGVIALGCVAAAATYLLAAPYAWPIIHRVVEVVLPILR